MRTDVFPNEFNKAVDLRTSTKIEEAKKRSAEIIQSINNLRPRDKDGSDWNVILVFIGIVGGFFACSLAGSLSDSILDAGPDSLVYAFGTYAVVWFILFRIRASIKKFSLREYRNKQIEADSRIREEEKSLEKEVQKIRSDAQNEKNEYFNEFENNVQKLSVQLAESELSKEVIGWITDGFSDTIDAADRRSHVEKIIVPFEFIVYKNRITCNLGTYDFELKRCRNLNSRIEQLALARVIASTVQLNLVMKYPKDLSGTDIYIDISYSYREECPVTTITYIAPNGDYKEVRGW